MTQGNESQEDITLVLTEATAVVSNLDYQRCLLCEQLGVGKVGLHTRDLSWLVTYGHLGSQQRVDRE